MDQVIPEQERKAAMERTEKPDYYRFAVFGDSGVTPMCRGPEGVSAPGIMAGKNF